jgi:DNA repair protein RecO (recombination protein O)
MRSRQYKTQGIILKRINVGEADRILTVFTKRHGKIRCLAPGVRKPTSRKSASIELFNLTNLFIAKGKNLDIVTQAETIESFSGIRENLKATKAAYHAVELIDLLTADGQENTSVFNALLELLKDINRQRHATRRQITDFEKILLKELGFGLPTDESEETLRNFIESIIERRLQSVEIFKNA